MGRRGVACKSVTGLDKMRWRQGVGEKEMEEEGVGRGLFNLGFGRA